jgi:hypothetical protein
MVRFGPLAGRVADGDRLCGSNRTERMITATLFLIVAVFGIGVLVWKWKAGATSLVLAAVPIGLLFLVLPIPPGIWHMIRGFQQISESARAGIVEAASLSLDVSQPLFWGSIAFVVIMAAAAALQATAGREDPEPPADGSEPAVSGEPTTPATSLTEQIFLVGSSLLVLPAAALVHLTVSIPRLVMSAADRLTDPAAAAAVDKLSLQQTSELISSRMVSSMLVGIPLSVFLLIACVACLVMLRPRRSPQWLTVYSWFVLAACTLLAAWNAVALNADIRSFQRVLSL